MIADVETKKKVSPIVTELFLRGRKLNISLVFISQSYFKMPKTIRLTATDYFIVNILDKRELEQVVSNHSTDTEFKDFMELSKEYAKKLFSFFSERYNFTIR